MRVEGGGHAENRSNTSQSSLQASLNSALLLDILLIVKVSVCVCVCVYVKKDCKAPRPRNTLAIINKLETIACNIVYNES
jgi:hypothetical protein